MTKKINNLDKIFDVIKEKIEQYGLPIISNPNWNEIEKTPFTTLISCILSLRTKDVITENAAKRLFKKYDTPHKIIYAREVDIQRIIYPTGFYRVKAKRIIEISKTLIEKYDGEVPKKFSELLKLKGVGRKTANIVMVYGFKKQGFLPIDTHCHRIPNRLGWINTKTPEETEKKLKEIMPEKYWEIFNHLFVRFGQMICVPISPFCSKCPIYDFCKRVDVIRSR
jgi:endonuclease-3